MKNLVKAIILLVVVITTSCDPIIGYKFNQGSLPSTPVNLTDFNTEYDDFNSTAPSFGYLIPFCFSTNRNSIGQEFDVIFQPMNVNFDKSTGDLKVTNEYANWQSKRQDYDIIKIGLDKIKTSKNEFGPNLMVENSTGEYEFTLLYSTDENGDADIMFTTTDAPLSFAEPKDIPFLNSDFDDMYPSFTSDKSKIYFCSNRDGDNFDFYYANVDPELDMKYLFSGDETYQIFKDSLLSSDAEDKCPFIFEDKLVFTSNRSGGYGGYDLYYCILENGVWSDPVNFGEEINTEFDEFRPILIDEGVTEDQTMMVFSSDRSGGLGGFDLYFVGIDR